MAASAPSFFLVYFAADQSRVTLSHARFLELITKRVGKKKAQSIDLVKGAEVPVKWPEKGKPDRDLTGVILASGKVKKFLDNISVNSLGTISPDKAKTKESNAAKQKYVNTVELAAKRLQLTSSHIREQSLLKDIASSTTNIAKEALLPPTEPAKRLELDDSEDEEADDSIKKSVGTEEIVCKCPKCPGAKFGAALKNMLVAKALMKKAWKEADDACQLLSTSLANLSSEELWPYEIPAEDKVAIMVKVLKKKNKEEEEEGTDNGGEDGPEYVLESTGCFISKSVLAEFTSQYFAKPGKMFSSILLELFGGLERLAPYTCKLLPDKPILAAKMYVNQNASFTLDDEKVTKAINNLCYKKKEKNVKKPLTPPSTEQSCSESLTDDQSDKEAALSRKRPHQPGGLSPPNIQATKVSVRVTSTSTNQLTQLEDHLPPPPPQFFQPPAQIPVDKYLEFVEWQKQQEKQQQQEQYYHQQHHQNQQQQPLSSYQPYENQYPQHHSSPLNPGLHIGQNRPMF